MDDVADRIEAFTVTIPANTPIASPVTIPVSFTQGEVTEIEIDIPPGSAGLMGFQVAYGQQVIIPHNSSEFIIRDSTGFRWPLSNFPTGEFWNVIGYNTDIYPHDVNLIFLIDEIGSSSVPAGSVIAAGVPPEIAITSSPEPAVPS